METLRFITAGEIDDGKSTLIGRLLHDCGALYPDQLQALKKTSQRVRSEEIDFSLVTDGLGLEREKGITIDIAFRYFSTKKRKFILADCPGHWEYVRNYFTGATHADLAVILVDVTRGLSPQTVLHASLAACFGIRHLVFCINKMDLLAFDQALFHQLEEEILTLCAQWESSILQIIPTSAKLGDNVVTRSPRMPWYRGPSLLAVLEDSQPTLFLDKALRVLIQGGQLNFFYGMVVGGKLSSGDRVYAQPPGIPVTIKKLYSVGRDAEYAEAGDAVCLQIHEAFPLSRGQVLTSLEASPPREEISSLLCWVGEEQRLGKPLLLRCGTAEVACTVEKVHSGAQNLRQNDLVHVCLRLSESIFMDAYENNRDTGSFILIDPSTANTVAGGILEDIGAQSPFS